MEDYLTKINKHKNGNKNKTKNRKALNYKPRFTPTEHKPASPIHASPLTDTTTITQNTRPRFKQYTSITTTQPAKPAHKDYASTCTMPQLLPQYTIAFHYKPYTEYTLERTHTRTIN